MCTFLCEEPYKKSADYLKLAGRKAEKSGSLNHAVSYTKKRISCLEKLPIDDDVEKKIIDARTVVGLYYNQMALHIEAKAAVDPIVDLVKRLNYKRRASQINIILGSYYAAVDENYTKALELYEKALKIGKELNDLVTLVMANIWMGVCLSDNGEFKKALPCFEKALEINVMANIQWTIAAVKAGMAVWLYCRQGNADLAYQSSYEALRVADESGDTFSKGIANYTLGLSYYLKGFFEEAREHLLKSVDFLQKSNQLAYAGAANFVLGDIYLEMKDYETSQKCYERLISLYQNVSIYPSTIISSQICVVLAKVMSKEKAINLNMIYKWYGDIKNKWIKSPMSNRIGKILLNIDDQYISEAEDWIKKAIQNNKKYGMRWNLAQDYALYSELHKRKGDPSKAREKLNEAIETFKECGADGWVERYEKELASLS